MKHKQLDAAWRNTLYIGDNLPIMRGLDSASVDLIYTDPPFNSKRRYQGAENIGNFDDIWSSEMVDKHDLYELEDQHPELAKFIRSSRKTHSEAMMYYLAFMAPRLIEMHRLLKADGSFYLHCDPHAGHYLKFILDGVFGRQNFRNEIVWRIGWVSGFKTQKKGWIRNHDTIFYYVRGRGAVAKFNKEYIPYAPGYVRRDGKPPNGKGVPMEDTWNCSVHDVLNSIAIMSFSKEKTGQPTQKPLALVGRIIAASSSPGDVVFDPFAGCATTLVQSHIMGRRYLGADINADAEMHIKNRLVQDTSVETLESLPVASRPLVTREMPVRSDVQLMSKREARPILERRWNKQSNPLCSGCDKAVELRFMEVDHIRARGRGGLDALDNYQLLCAPCNRGKGAGSLKALRIRNAKREHDAAMAELEEVGEGDGDSRMR